MSDTEISQEVSDTAGSVETAEPQAPETVAPEGAKSAAPAAPETPKDDKAEKAAALKARQVADFLKQERAFRAKEAEQKAAWEAREKAYAAKEAELRQIYEQMIERSKVFEELDKDPITWLQKHKGIGPEEYYNRAMNNGQPTKEEVLQRKLDAAMAKLEELDGWRSKQEEAAKTWQERQEQARREAEEKKLQEAADAELAAAQNEFWGKIETNPKTYPYLAAYPKEVILDAAAKYVHSLGKKAETLSYDDVAKELESSAREMHESLHSKVSSLLAPETPPAGATPQQATEKPAAATAALETATANAKPAKNRRAVGKAASSITLNAEMTAARTNAKTTLSRDEEIEKLKRELESAGVQ